MNIKNNIEKDTLSAGSSLSDRTLLAQQTNLLYRQIKPSLALSVAVAALLTGILWQESNRTLLGAWFIALLFGASTRLWIASQYRRFYTKPDDPKYWRNLFVFGVALTGTIWGMVGVFAVPEHSLPHMVFLALILGGMAVGSTPYLSAHLGAYLAFAVPCTLPYAVYLTTRSEPVIQLMGFLLGLYIVMLIAASKRLHNAIMESLSLKQTNAGLVASLHDAQERISSEELAKKQAELTAREHEQRVRQLTDATFEGIVVHDHGVILDTNETLAKMIGITREDAIGRNVLEFVQKESHSTVVDRLRHPRLEPFEVVAQRIDGTTFPVQLRARDYYHEGRTVRVVVIRDLTESRNAEEQLYRLANVDALTGLENRHQFQEALKRAVGRAQRDNQILAVAFIDLDNFKLINDSLGHETGDELLKYIAGRLSETVRHHDSLTRWGADEFALILGPLKDIDEAAFVSKRILTALEEHIVLEGKDIYTSASMGVSVFPADSDDPLILIHNAEAAMHRAKDKGPRSIEFYKEEINRKTAERYTMETRLRQAIEKGEFVLHYQPKIELQTGSVIGVEALIRWNHPGLGIIPPSQFIPLAEQSGLIVPIGDWVLNAAAQQINRWQQSGLQPVPIAVNLSLRQLKQSDVVFNVMSALGYHGVSPNLLEIEITESTLADNLDGAVELMSSLHDAGIRIAIDDFGTGYSSLSYLKQFPVDYLKIDRSFMRDIPENPDDTAIATTIIAMAENLGLQVIAEGVETQEQMNFLMEKGCYAAQGFLISKPLSEDKISKWLRNPPSQMIIDQDASRGTMH